MVYREDLGFRNVFLYETGEGVNVYYEFKRSMVPSSPWVIPRVEGNLRYITPSRSIPEIDSKISKSFSRTSLENVLNCFKSYSQSSYCLFIDFI